MQSMPPLIKSTADKALYIQRGWHAGNWSSCRPFAGVLYERRKLFYYTATRRPPKEEPGKILLV